MFLRPGGRLDLLVRLSPGFADKATSAYHVYSLTDTVRVSGPKGVAINISMIFGVLTSVNVEYEARGLNPEYERNTI